MPRPDTRAIWNANASAWTEMSRAGYDVYRDIVNTPAFFELLPALDGRLGLDLGCGEGHNTRLLTQLGARVVALDIAETFLSAASSASDEIAFVHADGARLPFRDAGLHFVTAFMSLMDIADPEATLVEIARVLEPGGFVQFSVVHPVNGTPIRRWVDDTDGSREALTIGDYFEEGPITEVWTFGTAPDEMRSRHEPFRIPYERRTLAGWLNAVLQAGLRIDAIAEPHPDEGTAAAFPDIADCRIAPYFLLVRARRD
ncbi:MAG: class I SAM-dependent methyltransferase [Ilumatobacteraceae bacterium]